VQTVVKWVHINWMLLHKLNNCHQETPCTMEVSHPFVLAGQFVLTVLAAQCVKRFDHRLLIIVPSLGSNLKFVKSKQS
jgi:hypothetical protein